MLEGIEVLCHSSIRISRGKVIYIDPYKIQQNYNDADIIFITHNHYDHYSKEDIDKVKKAETIIVATEDLFDRLLKDGFSEDKIKIIVSNILEIEGIRYYIAGDTDITEENKKVKCNVAFVPVGGIYTMNAKEAAELVNTIKPEIAVPIHYGSVVGTKKDTEKFIKLLNSEIEGVILMR